MSDNYYENNDSYSNNQSSTNKYSLNESQLNETHYGETNQYNSYGQQNQYNPYGQSAQSNSYYNQYGQPSQSGYQNSAYGTAYNDYYPTQQRTVLNGGYSREVSEATVRSVLTNAYLYMFLGLLVTGIFSSFMANSILDSGELNVPLFLVALFLELPVVIGASSAMKKNNVTLSYILFFLYSALNGITLSVLLISYTTQSLVTAFFMCAAIFGIMTAFGAFTKMDLTKIGSLCAIGLFGIIIASIINFFIGSNSIDYAVSAIAIVIFIGLTAYDTQKIKDMASSHSSYSPTVIGLWGALELYLDFINLFIRILRIMGRRR